MEPDEKGRSGVCGHLSFGITSTSARLSARAGNRARETVAEMESSGVSPAKVVLRLLSVIEESIVPITT